MASAAESPLRISEFAAGGRQGLIDEDGDSPDWIEIQNVSAEAVDLSGWSLRAHRPEWWHFPRRNITANGFVVVFASGKNRRIPGGPIHTDFKLRAEGGSVTLRAPNGAEFAVTNYPPQVPGVSFGWGSVAETGETPRAYLSSLTPGRSNSPPVATGPFVLNVSHEPTVPQPGGELAVRARIARGAATVKVNLRYRFMWEPETELPMHDDGKHGDGDPDDGIYGVVIPMGGAAAGSMLRYRVLTEDGDGRRSRWPLFERRPAYSGYLGTIIADGSIQSRLPVVHTFNEGQGPLDRVSLFYEGELYDNVAVAEHGQFSRSFPKPSFNWEFPFDHLFRHQTNEARVREVKILGNFADKSKIRNTLAYETIAAAGSVGHFAFPVRLQLNGKFFCVAEMVEDGDERWLDRVGLDPGGALYKMNDLLDPGSAEKRTRKREGRRDIAEFVSQVAQQRSLPERAAYAYDHLDVPQCISYLVAMAMISSGDHGHKNYYLYCDTRGSGEWALLPWDVDLSWGRNWMKTYFDDHLYADNPLHLYRASRDGNGRNPVYNIIFEHPEFRAMYLRRLRTVMDELLQPPETPPEKRILEKRIREWMDLIDPPAIDRSDADLDSAEWPGWAPARSARAEAERIIREYLPGRRSFLFKNRGPVLHGDRIPESQANNVDLEIVRVERVERHAEAAEQFVCITNAHRVAIDLSGWRLAGAGIEHRIRPGTVIPSGKGLYIVSDAKGFRGRKSGPRGGQSLLVQGNWKGTLGEGELRLTDGNGRVVARHAAN